MKYTCLNSTVRRLVTRAKEHVPIETVLYDREFDGIYQTLSNLGVNYLVPKRINNTEQETIEMMQTEGQAFAAESASVRVETGSHLMQFLYVYRSKVMRKLSLRRILELGQ